MTRRIVRFGVFAGLTLAATTSCQTIVMDQLKTVSAGHTGCTPDQLSISNHQNTLTGETWNATCNGRVYLCSGAYSGKSSEDFSCAPAAK